MIYTEHREFRGLKDDVLKHWDEDWPRLVLADWCDDNNEAALARLLRWDKPVPLERSVGYWICRRDPDPYDALDRLALRAASWLAESADQCVVWRGFVSEIGLTLASWEKNGRTLAAAHPLRRVWLTDRETIGPIEGGPQKGGYFFMRRDLNDALYACLYGLPRRRPAHHAIRSPIYDSRQLAFEALSAACLKVARGE